MPRGSVAGELKQPPTGWGLNPLTSSFDAARENQFATFFNKDVSKDLTSIDRLLWGLLIDHVNPRPLLPIDFLLRAHSTFRAAAACAMAGQVYESTVLSRSVLESAAYGLFVRDDDERSKLWFSRGDSEGAKGRVRTAFGFGNLRRDFESHFPALAAAFVSLYETLVDFGAHPNEPGFSINKRIHREEGARIIDTIYMHDDALPLDFGLRNLARVGLWSALVFAEVYPSDFAKRGLGAQLNQLAAKY